jgi:hypothetical protein
MRGISAVVELLLILLIVISLAALFWLFTSGTIKSLTGAGTERTERTREILSTCMIVDSVHENKIYIKNCGDGIIVNDSLNVFLDDEALEFNMSPQTIRKGDIGTVTIENDDLLFSKLSSGDHDIKISNPSLQIVQRLEAIFPFSCGFNNVILCLDFDEGSGSKAYDRSSSSNNGTLVNNPIWVDGKFGKALQFSGSNYVSASKSSSGNNQFTLDTMFKTSSIAPDDDGGFRLISVYGDSLSSTKIALRLVGSDVAISYRNSGGSFITKRVTEMYNDNNWHHLIGMHDGSTVKLYYDGKLEGTWSDTLTGLTTTSIDRIATLDGSSGNFIGTMDYVRIFNKSLTQSEIDGIINRNTNEALFANHLHDKINLRMK